MNTRARRIAAVLGTVTVLALALVPVIEAQTDYRFSFPFGIRSNNTGAALFVRQDGSGSIATFRDGASDEFTIDQSSWTATNPGTAAGMTVSGFNAMPTAVPIAAVNATAIAPLGSIQPVSAAGTATVPLTIPSAGRSVCLYNTGTPIITIADTGAQMLTAAAALGQYDWLCGWSDGTNFYETSRADN